jgi:hypothetical protein
MGFIPSMLDKYFSSVLVTDFHSGTPPTTVSTCPDVPTGNGLNSDFSFDILVKSGSTKGIANSFKKSNRLIVFLFYIPPNKSK